MKTLKHILIAASFLTSTAAFAGDFEFTGFVGGDSRSFWLDGRYPQQQSSNNWSLMMQPELYWRSESSQHRVSVVGFGRWDSHDDQRSHADLREAHWGYEADGWDTTVGVSKVFWGVAESRHLVDVINQTDLVEDPDQEEKLGQPMLNLNVQRDYGLFGFYVLPYFRERTFPGVEGRLRTPLPVDTGNAVYESSDEQKHVDYAFRYSHYFGDLDVGFSLFDGTSREPNLILAAEGDRLTPVYQQMTQAGADLQYTQDAWLWKLEAIGRDTSSDRFAALVGGFEYTLFGVRESNADLGLLVEYLYDGRSIESPATAFENDVFVGARLALNNAADTSVLAGVVTDLDSRELFVNIEAERRFGDNLSAELRVRAFLNAEPGNLLNAIERDDYVQLRLNWYY